MKNLLIISISFMSLGVFSQSKFETNREGSEYKFKVLKDLEATDVQNQGRTSTCWSFSSLSFFESEIIRLKNERHNLSEMFIARNAYLGKAENYLRMYGTFTFGPGGAFHDIPWVIKTELLKSKSKNTAVENRKVQGKVIMTFLNGDLAFKS